VRGVSGQIDEDMNAVRMNSCRRGFVAEIDQAVPRGKAGFHAGARLVLLRQRRVGHEFDPGGIEMRENAFDKESDRM